MLALHVYHACIGYVEETTKQETGNNVASWETSHVIAAGFNWSKPVGFGVGNRERGWLGLQRGLDADCLNGARGYERAVCGPHQTPCFLTTRRAGDAHCLHAPVKCSCHRPRPRFSQRFRKRKGEKNFVFKIFASSNDFARSFASHRTWTENRRAEAGSSKKLSYNCWPCTRERQSVRSAKTKHVAQCQVRFLDNSAKFGIVVCQDELRLSVPATASSKRHDYRTWNTST